MRLPGCAPESNRDRTMKNLLHRHNQITIDKIYQKHNHRSCIALVRRRRYGMQTVPPKSLPCAWIWKPSEISDSISQHQKKCKLFLPCPHVFSNSSDKSELYLHPPVKYGCSLPPHFLTVCAVNAQACLNCYCIYTTLEERGSLVMIQDLMA